PGTEGREPARDPEPDPGSASRDQRHFAGVGAVRKHRRPPLKGRSRAGGKPARDSVRDQYEVEVEVVVPVVVASVVVASVVVRAVSVAASPAVWLTSVSQ